MCRHGTGRKGRVAAVRYSQASMGRIFVARVDHGEDFPGMVRDLLAKEGISHALIIFLGALRGGSLVTGPEEPVIPPSPHWVHFGGGWEVVGVATAYPGGDGPAIHFHGSIGHGDQARTGCLRGKADTYLVMEAVIFELMDLPVRRAHDEETGLSLPDFDA